MDILLLSFMALVLIGGAAAYFGWAYRARGRHLDAIHNEIVRAGDRLGLEIRAARPNPMIQEGLVDAVRGVERQVAAIQSTLVEVRDLVVRMEGTSSQFIRSGMSGTGIEEPPRQVHVQQDEQDEARKFGASELFRRLKLGAVPDGYQVIALELESQGDPIKGVPLSLIRTRGGRRGLLWIAENGRDIGRLLGHRVDLDPDMVRLIWGRSEVEGSELPGLHFRRIPAGTVSPENSPWGQDVDRWIPVV